MSDAPVPPPDTLLDSFARGELSSRDSRRLALESLDDPELFEELTAIALAMAAVSPPARLRAPSPRRWIAWTAVAAGLILIAFSLSRSTPGPAAPALPPVLASTGSPEQPILLASGLQPDGARVFRGIEPEAREPRLNGRIVAAEASVISVDLGSLDGLAKDSELLVFADGGSTTLAGRLVVTAAFRERAEARVVEGPSPVAGMTVRVSAADHLRALFDLTGARSGRGDLPAARAAAEEAVRFAESENLPQRPLAWNRLAVFAILGGDYTTAAPLLRNALAVLPKSDPEFAEVANNSAVLAELRKNRRQAVELYHEAFAAATSHGRADESRVIESNLARARDSH